MDPLCVRRRLLSVGCLLRLLWPGIQRSLLDIFSKKSPREIENIKKRICKVFSDNNLKITIEANKECVNNLDITLDLRSSSYKPYMKPGNTPLHVNHHSNHPPSVLRGIPDVINKRLSNISSDTQSFDSAAPPYQEVLRKSGFDYKLHYNPQLPKPKRHRNRKPYGLNPPYSANVPRTLVTNPCKLLTNASPQSPII